MTIETQNVVDPALGPAVQVTFIDSQSRRFSANIAVAQATTDAVNALATVLQAQAATSAPGLVDTAAQVSADIAPFVNDGSPPSDPSEG